MAVPSSLASSFVDKLLAQLAQFEPKDSLAVEPVPPLFHQLAQSFR